MQETNENVAAIDIGANFIRMTIAGISPNGNINIIDNLQKNTSIGRDTFNFKRIKAESVRSTCDILKGFVNVMNDYGVKSYLAICTSGIRDAENKEYIIEQIRMKTGLKVKIINNAEERFFMLKAIKSKLSKENAAFNSGTAVLNIGSGGIEFYIFENGKLKATNYLDMGALRIGETFSEIEKDNLDFGNVLEEYVNSKIINLKSYLINLKIDNFVVLGGELKFILKLHKEGCFIDKAWMNSFYAEVKKMTVGNLADKYEIPLRQAKVLLPNVVILSQFLKLTRAKGIYVLGSSLRDGMLIDLSHKKLKKIGQNTFKGDIINSVWVIGKKYGIDMAHARRIKKLALKIFDSTLEIHTLCNRERLFLEVAATLHDAGNYVNVNRHFIYSYDIINYEQIIGFSDRERAILANVVMYHEELIPSFNEWNYVNLSYEDKIVVSKLSAILKLAESLDISQKGKIKELNIELCESEAYFDIFSQSDCTLEKWSFNKNASFFEEVMGAKPIIR
ncbi:Ppx/GppA phosphatase family protein [Clostridium hydrogenum]|uniref:Ppx/GppA phosphatase family protein n=1 Tax=Clostridium hydrogenum TaxID=2855764 RepID=UPI001F1E666A|nr:exopolyphosphatase [Clostridium hydrogenum]